jgi:hypothetical protein
MARAAIDPFWTMNYVPAVLGGFLLGNPNNFVITNLFWFAFLLYVPSTPRKRLSRSLMLPLHVFYSLDLVAKGSVHLSRRTSKVATVLIWAQVGLVIIGEIVCLVLVGVDLHETAWRFFPLWAGSILIIPMVFYSVRCFFRASLICPTPSSHT